MPDIYSPGEDSYLLSKILEEEIPGLLRKNPNLKFLEIGSGSGIQLRKALKSGLKKENIFSCDINSLAVKHCKNLGFYCIKSNLFEAFEKGGVIVRGTLVPHKFDLIVFNPPYLPEDSREPKTSGLSTTGGKEGSNVINKFLKQSKKHLNENGRIFLVISSLTKLINFRGYKKKILTKENLFFEKLFVLELRS